MKHYTEKTAMNYALKDMSDDYSHKICAGNTKDIWFFSPWKLINKQTQKLNKVLGINKLNYINRYR